MSIANIKKALIIAFLCISALCGLACDMFIFRSFSLNYLLIGMAHSAFTVNAVPEEKTANALKMYAPVLNFSLVCVIVNLGMLLDYRLIAGAGLFTLIYILSRAAGKIGGAFLGGKLTKSAPTVTKYPGFTLLPHSGVSLVFMGIAVSTLSGFDPSSASVVSGTAAAVIINEIIAVVAAKLAFKPAGEIKK